MSSGKQDAELAHGSEADLSSLVQHNKVTYEAGPARVSSVGSHRSIRFTLSLYASPERLSDASSGSEELQPIWRELGRIARAALPAQLGRVFFSLEPFQPFVEYSRVRGYRPDVVLTFSLVHDALDSSVSVETHETQCLGPVEQNLRALGVRERRWK